MGIYEVDGETDDIYNTEKPPFILAKIIHPNSYPLTSSGYPIGLRLGSNRVTMPIHDY